MECVCSTIAVTFNPLGPFSTQRMCLAISPIYCFLRDNSSKVEHLAVLLLQASGAFT